jgi:hypothetical protein
MLTCMITTTPRPISIFRSGRTHCREIDNGLFYRESRSSEVALEARSTLVNLTSTVGLVQSIDPRYCYHSHPQVADTILRPIHSHTSIHLFKFIRRYFIIRCGSYKRLNGEDRTIHGLDVRIRDMIVNELYVFAIISRRQFASAPDLTRFKTRMVSTVIFSYFLLDTVSQPFSLMSLRKFKLLAPTKAQSFKYQA